MWPKANECAVCGFAKANTADEAFMVLCGTTNLYPVQGRQARKAHVSQGFHLKTVIPSP